MQSQESVITLFSTSNSERGVRNIQTLRKWGEMMLNTSELDVVLETSEDVSNKTNSVNESTEKKFKLTRQELIESKQQELFDELIKYAISNFQKETLIKLKHELSSLIDEYDFTILDVFSEFVDGRYKTYYVEKPCEVCLMLSTTMEEQLEGLKKEDAIALLIEALEELHECDIRLFYLIVRKLFEKVNKKRLLLFEFYDLSYQYALYNANDYERAYILSQDYFKELDENVKEYFQASKEDVDFAYLKLSDSLEYVDKALTSKIAIALSQEDNETAFVYLARALCITKFMYVIRNKSEITYVRGLKL